MRHEAIGRALRMLRHRRGWRQRDLAGRSGVSRSVVSELERGRLGTHTVGALDRTAAALGASLRIDLRAAGTDIYRLLDADHAAIQSEWVSLLGLAGWDVVAEATFNHYGERGSVDVLAWHAESRVLLMVEIKTVVLDLQDLQAGVDRKMRVARPMATDRGWQPVRIVPFLLIAEGSTARRRIRDHGPLFHRYELRGHPALAWLRSPTAAAAPTGILCLTKLSPTRSGDRRRAGRQRMRRERPDSGGSHRQVPSEQAAGDTGTAAQRLTPPEQAADDSGPAGQRPMPSEQAADDAGPADQRLMPSRTGR